MLRKRREEMRSVSRSSGAALVVGGRRIGESHRVAFEVPAQQFAWDLPPLRPGNPAVFNSQNSQPPRSADLARYGQPVLSPAGGVVVEVA